MDSNKKLKMKKIILLLLFIPLVSFGQIITTADYGNIDIRNINDKYITIELNQIFPSGHLLTTLKYKNVLMRNGRKKKWNVSDNGDLIALIDKADILNYFDKYGYELASLDTNSSTHGNADFTYSVSETTVTLQKK